MDCSFKSSNEIQNFKNLVMGEGGGLIHVTGIMHLK